MAAARNRGDELRNSRKPGGPLMAFAGPGNNSAAIGSGEKDAHRLKRCSASGLSLAVDIVMVAETDAGKSVRCSLSRLWAFSANLTRYSSTLSPVSVR